MKSSHMFVSRHLLLATEKDANTQDWYREHTGHPAPDSYHLTYCVSIIKDLPGHQDTTRHSRLPCYTVV